MFKLGARHQLNNGLATLFWSGCWSGRGPIRDRFLVLFSICKNPSLIVGEARVDGQWAIHFGRTFSIVENVEWDNLSHELAAVHENANVDVISCSLEASGCFATGSMCHNFVMALLWFTSRRCGTPRSRPRLRFSFGK
jgi:hypothetical protein